LPQGVFDKVQGQYTTRLELLNTTTLETVLEEVKAKREGFKEFLFNMLRHVVKEHEEERIQGEVEMEQEDAGGGEEGSE
jgi:hypothetical protein